MTEQPTWQELEARYQRLGFKALVIALASYAALILCSVFDLPPQVTIVLVAMTAVSQGLAFYAQYRERECRWQAVRERWRDA